MGKVKINLSQAFAGQKVGVKQIEDWIWLVTAKVSAVSGINRHPCLRNRHGNYGSGGRICILHAPDFIDIPLR